MKPWQFIVVVLALSVIAGCRSDPAIPILERELRHKEDEIYRLRAMVDEMQDCPAYSERDARPSRPANAESGESRRHRGAPDAGKSPMVELPGQPTLEVPKELHVPAGASPLDAPEVPKGIEGPSQPLGPPKPDLNRRSSARPMPSERDEMDGPALDQEMGEARSRPGRITLASRGGSATPFKPSGDSRRVAGIALNRAMTGGISAEKGVGDQGVLVVVEPRDRAGRTIDAPAEMSVVVIDPALEGNAARVARWDFSAAETAGMFRRAGSAQAIHLATVWPAGPPAHNKLHLFVRYVTADGRKLQTDAPIEVALPGDKTARWNRNDRRPDRNPPPEPREDVPPPTARVPGPTPHTAPPSDNAVSRRPVWSPERM
jgi:hypothetical protein